MLQTTGVHPRLAKWVTVLQKHKWVINFYKEQPLEATTLSHSLSLAPPLPFPLSPLLPQNIVQSLLARGDRYTELADVELVMQKVPSPGICQQATHNQ